MVIDVIRAFTTTQIALEGGVERIVLAGTLEQARRLARQGRVLAGERGAIAPDDFDLGNSPPEHEAADLKGTQLVLTTSNGVQATLHALEGMPVVVTGFSNAGTTVGYLRRLVAEGADRIQLIASHPDGDEDLACAQWIRARLVGDEKPTDREVLDRIRNCRAAAKFLDPDRPEYRSDDIDYCARRADAPWAMVARRAGNLPIVERRDVAAS